MLIFDPPDSNPLVKMHRAAFPSANTTRIREHRFVFDRLFDETVAQEEVYANTTRPLLDSVLDGYNATVFAYGATGCGKTHTISGTPQSPGIIFLTMKELFDKIADIRDTKLVDVSLSYLEIYNETIRDLLEPSNKQLVLREDVNKKISVSNLSSHKPQNVEAVMDMVLQGNRNRTVSPTEANATSSRSHAVLQINVVQKSRTADVSQAHTFATLSIIDLAGSERASATKNRGERLLEGANINKSLLALGNCINALCDPRRRNHVPYRDSKLTRLLKFSLGGNCKTVMIVCVSPSSRHYDETLNTLKYADRAKKIKTKVIRNEHNLDRHVGSYLKMVTEQKAEIEELRRRESKAGAIALATAEKARKKCLKALDDAVGSLAETYSTTMKLQEQTCKTLKQLRNLINQINQVECILTSFNTVLNSSEPPLTKSFPAFTTLSEGMKQALQKLKSDKTTLETYCASVTKDKEMRNIALTTLTRRLEATPGWTDADRVSFQAQSEAICLKSELKMLEEVAGEPIPTKIIDNLSLLFFTSMAKMGGLRSKRTTTMSQEISKTIDEIMKLCQSRFEAILGDYSIATNDSNAQTALSSIIASAIKPPSMTTLQSEETKKSSSPAKSSRRLSGGLSSSAHSNGSRRLRGGIPRTAASLHARRQFPGSAKKQVVVKSPMRNHRKAARRVKWEDDGEINLDPPTPSRVKSAGVTKNKVANKTKKAPEEELSLAGLSLEDAQVDGIEDDEEVKRVLGTSKVSAAKKAFLAPSPPLGATKDSTAAPPSPPKPGRGFGVKGSLARKPESSATSRLSMPPTLTAQQGRGTPPSRTGRLSSPDLERLSPPIALTNKTTLKADKENTRPISPERSSSDSSTTVTTKTPPTTNIVKPPTPPSSNTNTNTSATRIPSKTKRDSMPPAAVGAAGAAKAASVSATSTPTNSSSSTTTTTRSLGAPARLVASTASSASKHISQR